MFVHYFKKKKKKKDTEGKSQGKQRCVCVGGGRRDNIDYVPARLNGFDPETQFNKF